MLTLNREPCRPTRLSTGAWHGADKLTGALENSSSRGCVTDLSLKRLGCCTLCGAAARRRGAWHGADGLTGRLEKSSEGPRSVLRYRSVLVLAAWVPLLAPAPAPALRPRALARPVSLRLQCNTERSSEHRGRLCARVGGVDSRLCVRARYGCVPVYPHTSAEHASEVSDCLRYK